MAEEMPAGWSLPWLKSCGVKVSLKAAGSEASLPLFITFLIRVVQGHSSSPE